MSAVVKLADRGFLTTVMPTFYGVLLRDLPLLGRVDTSPDDAKPDLEPRRAPARARVDLGIRLNSRWGSVMMGFAG